MEYRGWRKTAGVEKMTNGVPELPDVESAGDLSALDDDRLRARLSTLPIRQQVEVNLNDLWALEIWLTYVETNLVVNFTDPDGKTVKTVKFEPRDQMSRGEFMSRLGQLPPGIVYEWHMAVVDIVRDWAVPF